MLYRVLGKTGLNVSAFGLGVMRMPVTDPDDSKTLDFERGVEMIRYAIDHGVNYFDSAYVYHGGRSEELLGAALKDGYREKAIIATKLPLSEVKKPEDMDRMLNTSLERLGVDHIDIYLMHGVKMERWSALLEMNVQGFLDRAKADGRINYTGFSFHDNFNAFKKVIDDYDWDMTLIQLNYVDERFQAGIDGLRYAARRGLGVAVMEPLKGGTLAKNTTEEVRRIFERAPVKRTLSPSGCFCEHRTNTPARSLFHSSFCFYTCGNKPQSYMAVLCFGGGVCFVDNIARREPHTQKRKLKQPAA